MGVRNDTCEPPRVRIKPACGIICVLFVVTFCLRNLSGFIGRGWQSFAALFRSYMINQPDLIKTVLKTRPEDFPKSTRISEGLRPLLGDSVFLTNGAQWQAQRRIIDPAFEGGRLREVMPSMQAAANAAVDRIEEGVQEFEELTRQRADQIAAGTAPDDLATKIMTTPDPETGRCFEWREMVDQVAIFSWPVMKPAHLRLLVALPSGGKSRGADAPC